MRRLDEERNGEGMTQPTQPRWFKISEVQLTALRKGWTHTSLYDQKGILQSVWEDQMIDCAPPNTTSEPVDDGNCTANEREIIRLCEQVMILSESLENCHKLVKFNTPTTERDKVLDILEQLLCARHKYVGSSRVITGTPEEIYDELFDAMQALRTPTPEAHP